MADIPRREIAGRGGRSLGVRARALELHVDAPDRAAGNLDAHIAMAHSGEGELLVRSLECMIVHQTDYTFWNTLLVGGQIKIDSVPPDRRKYVIEKPF